MQYSERTRLLYGSGAQGSEQHLPVSPLRFFLQYDGVKASMGLRRCMHAAVTDDVKELQLDVEGRDMFAQRVALMQQLAGRLYL